MEKMKLVGVSLFTLLLPCAGWAGRGAPAPAAVSAPSMGEGGLLLLAIGLAGTGIALLCRLKR